MNRWQISYLIDGLHDIIGEPGSELTINNVKFRYNGSQRVGSIILDADNENNALEEAAYHINRALAKMCFAYSTEASIGQGYYVIDLASNSTNRWMGTEFVDRWSYVKEDPLTTLSKMELLSPEKQEVLDLALAYYKLAEYANPLRIESLFSCMTTIARDLLNKKPNEDIKTRKLKESIKAVLQQTRDNFDESQFDKEWIAFYSAERCSISHGKGSKLIDIGTLAEHERIVNIVGGWARDMVYYYIDMFKKK